MIRAREREKEIAKWTEMLIEEKATLREFRSTKAEMYLKSIVGAETETGSRVQTEIAAGVETETGSTVEILIDRLVD